MAGGGGSLSVPEPGPNPAGCWVPGGRCTHVPRSHSPRAVQSLAASSSCLVGAHLTCLPPHGGGHPTGPQGAGSMSPSRGLRSCHLQSDVQAHKASLRPAGVASPHWWRAAPWKHHPSSVKAAQFPGHISSAASTLGYTGNTLLCFGAAPFTKI